MYPIMKTKKIKQHVLLKLKKVPLGRTRRPGRPLKARQCLQGQPQYEPIISDEDDDKDVL